MGIAAFVAVLAALVSFPGLIIGLLLIGVGYVLRKYVEKKWPNEAALLDAVATKYGKQAEQAVKDAKARAGL